MDLYIRAVEEGIPVQVIHNASIMNAAAACGLQLYNFGQTVSIPFFTPEWRPDSFYPKIKFNRSGGLHTLCLLGMCTCQPPSLCTMSMAHACAPLPTAPDIKVKEPDFAALMQGRTAFEPPRFMSVNTAIEQLLELEERNEGGAYSADTKCFGVVRVGMDDQLIVSGTMDELRTVDFGGPLHSFVIAGEMHELETRMYEFFHISKRSDLGTVEPGTVCDTYEDFDRLGTAGAYKR